MKLWVKFISILLTQTPQPIIAAPLHELPIGLASSLAIIVLSTRSTCTAASAGRAAVRARSCAVSGGAPVVRCGDRPGAVMSAEGNGFATEQLSRFFNAKPQTCALETCIAEDRVWVSTNPQIAGHLCRTLPDAFGVTLSAAPTAACAKRQVRDLRALPRRGLRAFRANNLGRVTDFSSNRAVVKRFWTSNPTL